MYTLKLNRKIGGEYTRENAGMSSEKVSENLTRQKPKVSWARLVLPG